jgi:hypothetical protein
MAVVRHENTRSRTPAFCSERVAFLFYFFSNAKMPPSEAIPLNPPHATAFNAFRVEKQSHPGRQRAKFGPQRRREVEAVR